MSQLFAVTRTHGWQWNPGRSLEEQDFWQPHADFMNALVHDGFVLLGGPLEGTPDVLLIIRANHADQIMMRLADDPWSPTASSASPILIPGPSASDVSPASRNKFQTHFQPLKNP